MFFGDFLHRFALFDTFSRTMNNATDATKWHQKSPAIFCRQRTTPNTAQLTQEYIGSG